MQTQNTAAIDGVVPTSIAGVATTHPHQLPPSKKRTRTDATAKAVRVGKTWTARLRRSGHDVYETGHKTRADAELAAAKELATRDVTVNAVAPGFIDTDMTRELPEAQREALQTQIPLGRLGQAQEIANVVAFLASDGAAYVTGATIPVNGGMYMS